MPTSIIKVYNGKYGRWEKNAKVVLGWWAGMSKPVYTNTNGLAEVNHSSTGKAAIYINGKEVGKINTPGSITITI